MGTVEGRGGGCDYPVDILYKIVSRSLQNWSPIGYRWNRPEPAAPAPAALAAPAPAPGGLPRVAAAPAPAA